MSKASNSVKSYGKCLMLASIGYLSAMSVFLGNISPLGMALIGSTGGINTVSVFLGMSLGLLITGDFIRIIPMILCGSVVMVIRLIIGKNKGLAVRLGSGALCCSGLLLTYVIDAARPSELAAVCLSAFAGGVSCYGFLSFFEKLKSGKPIVSLNPVKEIPLGLGAVLALSSLSSVSFGIFNIGGVLSAVIILFFGYRFRFSGGATAGIICALGLAAYSVNGSLAMAAGAVIVSAVAVKGRLPSAACFVFTLALTSAVLGMDKTMLSLIADGTVGSVIFMLIPLEQIIGNKKTKERIFGKGESTANVFAGRLQLVGSTMGELRYAVEKTAEALDEDNEKDISSVYNSACDEVCRNCRFNIKCWGDEYNDSSRTMNRLVGLMKMGEKITPDSFTGTLSGRCPKKQQLCDIIKKKYEDYLSVGQMNRRIKEMRGILTKQLDNMEKLFNSIAQEFERNVAYNREASQKTERLMERCGLSGSKAAVRINEGYMSLEAYGEGDLNCTAEEFGDLLSEALEKDFDLPMLLKFGGKMRITAFEQAEYSVKSSVCQINRKNDSYSGDYTSSCIDGKGCYYCILSDGMGSGVRARIDSAFVCGLLVKLLESGIEPESAIDLLNTSLNVKSSDESFATVDLCKVDLYSGRTTIYKAGGADSYIRVGKNVTKIKGKGLPVGICENVALSSHSFIAGENDVIILTSDGAELSEQWIEQVFSRESGSNISELAKTVASAAKFNCEKGREDDISIVAIQIKR